MDQQAYMLKSASTSTLCRRSLVKPCQFGLIVASIYLVAICILVPCAGTSDGAKAAMEDIVDNGWKDEAMGGVKKMMAVMEVVRMDNTM